MKQDSISQMIKLLTALWFDTQRKNTYKRFTMFGIGGQELILILLLALIILGPKKLPDIAKTLGKALGDFQRATDGLKKEIDQASDLTSAEPPEEKQKSKEEPDKIEPEKNEQDPAQEESEKKTDQDNSTYHPDEIEG
jgi:TatA/E family protein of Tat protein translocase